MLDGWTAQNQYSSIFLLCLCVGVFYSKPYVLCARFCVRCMWGKTDKTGGLLWGAGRPVSQHNLRDDSQKSHKTCSSGICRFYSFFIRWRLNIKNCLFSGFQSVSPSFTWNELYWQPASPLFLIVYCSYQMLKKIQFWFFHLAIWRDHWQLQTEKRRREAKYGFAGPGAGCLSDKVSFQQLLFLYNVFGSK